jgi:acetyltransferase
MTASIRRIAHESFPEHLAALIALLQDAVDSGASVGFLYPLSTDAATAYWTSVHGAVRSGSRVLLAAFEDQDLVGAVQLDLAGMPNGSHRAEVMKLFVQRWARRKGVAKALMRAIEDEARTRGRQLLVLDTRAGDVAEKLYEEIGYTKAGAIPRYARSSNGDLDATVFMYRWLGPGPR